MKQFTSDDIGHCLSSFRAKNEELAKDPYAKLWTTPGADKFHEYCLEHIGPYEGIVHALRNRAILDEMEKFLKQGPGLYLNLGAGFSNYGFLLPEQVKIYEVDCPEVVQVKKKSITEFYRNKIVPRSDFNFFETDLNDIEKLERLDSFIKNITPNNIKVFVVIEGVFYFLNKESIDKLMNILEKNLPAGSKICAVSLRPEIAHSNAYKRMVAMFDQGLVENDSCYTFLEDSYYQNLNGFSCIHSCDFNDLVRHYKLEEKVPKNDPNNIVVETIYMLEKD